MRPRPGPGRAPRWEKIDTVLLDMDGTLLDRHFDDHFWMEHVPKVYAGRRRIPIFRAREVLLDRYRSQEGTLNWTDLDYWSDELDLDIPALKAQVDHLIVVQPFVQDFLDRVSAAGKRIWLVTNAHGTTLRMKMKKTALERRLDGAVTSHELGAPKEKRDFWAALQGRLGFDPSRTLLAEDTEAVLEAAAAFGIRWLVHVARSSSALPAKPSQRFFSIDWFRQIMPSGTGADPEA